MALVNRPRIFCESPGDTGAPAALAITRLRGLSSKGTITLRRDFQRAAVIAQDEKMQILKAQLAKMQASFSQRRRGRQG